MKIKLRRLIKAVSSENPTITSTELKDEVLSRFRSKEPMTDSEIEDCKEIIAEMVANSHS